MRSLVTALLFSLVGWSVPQALQPQPAAAAAPQGSRQSASSAAPQASRQQAQQPTTAPPPLSRAGGFSASVEMVRVPVVVLDKNGGFVGDLEPEDFGVMDAGSRHEVRNFISDASPASVGILVDTSAGMKQYEEGVRQAIRVATDNLRPADEVFVIAYGASPNTLVQPTINKLAAYTAADDYACIDSDDRALYDALDLGITTLEKSPYDKRSLIVIGGGGDTVSSTGEVDIQQHIHRTGVSIHTVALAPVPQSAINSTARVNRTQTLPEIARFTGGLVAQRPRSWGRYGDADHWFEAAGKDITTYVKHQYVLHYVPTQPPRPGTWREIRVSVDGNARQIRARSGYVR